MERLLAVDLGNSRCKLRLLGSLGEKRPVLIEGADCEVGPALAARVEQILAGWNAAQPPDCAAALSSVASPAHGAALVERLRERYGARLLESPECGLENLCDPPERVGRDRLYAARGAFEIVGASAVVVDAGTALTVDALRAAGEGRAAFLGGAIAPGPALLAQALGAGGAQLAPFEPVPGARALGANTLDAMLGGVAVGFRGAARELVERVAGEAGLGDCPAVLTGGARQFLLEPDPFCGRRLVVEPDLVHLGLLRAALQALRPSSQSTSGTVPV